MSCSLRAIALSCFLLFSLEKEALALDKEGEPIAVSEDSSAAKKIKPLYAGPGYELYPIGYARIGMLCGERRDTIYLHNAKNDFPDVPDLTYRIRENADGSLSLLYAPVQPAAPFYDSTKAVSYALGMPEELGRFFCGSANSSERPSMYRIVKEGKPTAGVYAVDKEHYRATVTETSALKVEIPAELDLGKIRVEFKLTSHHGRQQLPLTRIVNKETTIKVDLLPKGVYTCQFIVNGELVRTETVELK